MSERTVFRLPTTKVTQAQHYWRRTAGWAPGEKLRVRFTVTIPESWESPIPISKRPQVNLLNIRKGSRLLLGIHLRPARPGQPHRWVLDRSGKEAVVPVRQPTESWEETFTVGGRLTVEVGQQKARGSWVPPVGLQVSIAVTVIPRTDPNEETMTIHPPGVLGPILWRNVFRSAGGVQLGGDVVAGIFNPDAPLGDVSRDPLAFQSRYSISDVRGLDTFSAPFEAPNKTIAAQVLLARPHFWRLTDEEIENIRLHGLNEVDVEDLGRVLRGVLHPGKKSGSLLSYSAWGRIWDEYREHVAPSSPPKPKPKPEPNPEPKPEPSPPPDPPQAEPVGDVVNRWVLAVHQIPDKLQPEKAVDGLAGSVHVFTVLAARLLARVALKAMETVRVGDETVLHRLIRRCVEVARGATTP